MQMVKICAILIYVIVASVPMTNNSQTKSLRLLTLKKRITDEIISEMHKY